MRRIYFFLSIFLLLGACRPDRTPVLINEQIPQGLRDAVKQLNTSMFQAMRTNQLEFLEQRFSTSFRKRLMSIEAAINNFQGLIPDVAFEPLDDYWVQPNALIQQPYLAGPSHTYFLQPDNQTLEQYFSLVVFQQKSSSLLAICTYVKEGGTWKMDNFQMGYKDYFGRDALHYFEQSKTELQADHLLNAYLDMLLVRDLRQPGGKLFQYRLDAEMSQFEQRVLDQIKSSYQLPLELEQIASKPELLSVGPQFSPNGHLPQISYQTNLSIQDESGLAQECDQIHALIEDLYPGIKTYSATIMYQVVNKESKSKGGSKSFVKKNQP
ncbi:MAG: hypothetical protein AAF587_32125 [Bacteroidota bacterium]